MSEEPRQVESVVDHGTLTYLWDEYKYRHELCWNAIYKLATAVVALGALPYVHENLTAALGGAMLIPPYVGTLLALFGVFVVNNELRLFAHAKLAHNHLHNRFLTNLIADPVVRVSAIDDLKPCLARWTLFDVYVHLLMVVIFVTSLANAAYLHYCWLQL